MLLKKYNCFYLEKDVEQEIEGCYGVEKCRGRGLKFGINGQNWIVWIRCDDWFCGGCGIWWEMGRDVEDSGFFVGDVI